MIEIDVDLKNIQKTHEHATQGCKKRMKVIKKLRRLGFSAMQLGSIFGMANPSIYYHMRSITPTSEQKGRAKAYFQANFLDQSTDPICRTIEINVDLKKIQDTHKNAVQGCSKRIEAIKSLRRLGFKIAALATVFGLSEVSVKRHTVGIKIEVDQRRLAGDYFILNYHGNQNPQPASTPDLEPQISQNDTVKYIRELEVAYQEAKDEIVELKSQLDAKSTFVPKYLFRGGKAVDNHSKRGIGE